MPDTPEQRSYKQTLNLPKTAFPMKANLVQNEPASQKHWRQMDLYGQLRAAKHPAGPFVFHDGPPYANGSIHLGHLLNKVLKDLVVRSKTMAGHDVPYIPGWDCHGLPIEHKVMQELGDQAREMAPIAIRRKCRTYAEKFVKRQSAQMQRLLTCADYDRPYLTMDPAFEAATLEVFAEMVDRGVVYRGLKPVHWSIENRTALAEAELEYADREDTSVFVLFDITTSDLDLPADTRLIIWTTTPWTLPANLAVAVHPRHTYGLYTLDHRPVLLATDLAANVFALRGQGAPAPARTFTGADLIGTRYSHPFLNDDKPRRVVPAEYVTLEDGTGLVHTAPGHGVEDYQTGLRENLDIYCPVRHDGTFDDTAPPWLRGVSVWQANDLILDRLSQSGHLHASHRFTHSYPHDWRSKTPVIFRATEQWFVDVDKAIAAHGGRTIRELALAAAADDIRFHPAWGRNRMRGMLETRPDWCLSRQRAWGLPIPAFYTADGGTLLTARSVRAVADHLRTHGSDAWYLHQPTELLAGYNPADDPDADDRIDLTTLTRGHDIFDVWFESGSSWYACMVQRGLAHDSTDDQPRPATDLYLEGSDQHRGWFQLSLLPAVTVTGRPPFRDVLTHGFMVDKDGRKMSKSGGNALDIDILLKDHGADVCRWWVSSLNTDNDIKVDESYFKIAGEQYRKIRNTIRFLLSNLHDFDPTRDTLPFAGSDITSLDAWATDRLIELSDTVRQAYDRYEFRRAHEALFHFCNDTLSATYLAAVKDRLYCDRPASRRRRRTQTALHRLADTLIRLLAPIVPHTADEAWRSLTGDPGACVHLLSFADLDPLRRVPADRRWPQVMQQRDRWLRAIERYRQEHDIDNPLALGLEAGGDLTGLDPVDLADLCGISRFTITPGDADHIHVHDLRDQPACQRSWKRDGTVRPRTDGGLLSDRDAEALGLSD